MGKPFLVGLTGSIGMGKSTTAKMFAEAGIPVWDADAAVHRLYAAGGLAVEGIAKVCPAAIIDGSVDRGALKDWIAKDSSALKQIEAIVHPLVAADRQAFIQTTDTPLVVLDIPLLFETGGHTRVDAVVVVSAPEEIQRARVLERGTMTEAQFEAIKAKQTPDAEKRAQADYVIETLSLDSAKAAVAAVLADINKRLPHA